MPAFPHHLCTILHAGGERAAPVVLRSEMERGIPRHRRAAADALVQVSLQLGFETAQASADFDAWFYGEALAGAAWFDFTNPRTNTVVQARVVGGDLGSLTPLAEAYRVAERSIELEYVRPGFRTLPPGLHSVTPAQVLQVQRASTATFVDSAGVLQTAAAHVARFEHSSFRTNIALFSEDFANAAWTKNQVTLTTGLTVGGLTGVTQVASNAGANDFLLQNINLLNGQMATTTWRIRQGTAAVNRFMRRTSAAPIEWNLVWTAGVPAPSAVPGGTVVTVTSLGGGWFDVSTTVALTEDNQGTRLYPDASNAGGTVFVKHAQFEFGSTVNPYVQTAGSPATAGIGDAQLLVETEAINCALGTDSDALTTWPTYVTGTGAVNRQVVVDARFGNVLRLTKTAGALGDRAGVGGPSRLSGMSGPSYVLSCWVRRSADAVGQVYVDAGRLTGGLITAAAPLSAAPAGQWTRLFATGSNPLGLAGGGAPYVWLDGPVGSTVDIKLPNVTLGTVLSSAFPAGVAPATRAADVIQVTA